MKILHTVRKIFVVFSDKSKISAFYLLILNNILGFTFYNIGTDIVLSKIESLEA